MARTAAWYMRGRRPFSARYVRLLAVLGLSIRDITFGATMLAGRTTLTARSGLHHILIRNRQACLTRGPVGLSGSMMTTEQQALADPQAACQALQGMLTLTTFVTMLRLCSVSAFRDFAVVWFLKFGSFSRRYSDPIQYWRRVTIDKGRLSHRKSSKSS